MWDMLDMCTGMGSIRGSVLTGDEQKLLLSPVPRSGRPSSRGPRSLVPADSCLCLLLILWPSPSLFISASFHFLLCKRYAKLVHVIKLLGKVNKQSL